MDYQQAVLLVTTERRAGNAFLRQKLFLSDSKVQRLLKQMEKDGIVSKAGAGGARQILAPAPAPLQAQPAGQPEVDA